MVASACLEAGLHVMCEKPLARHRARLRPDDRWRRSTAGKVLSVAENYRRDPIHRLARALIDDGAIGTPRLMIQTSIGGGDKHLDDALAAHEAHRLDAGRRAASTRPT